MIHRLTAVGWCLGTLLCVGGAAAQAQPAADPPAVPDASAAFAYEPVYVPAPAPAPYKAPPPPRFRKMVLGSVDVGMPYLLDVDHNLIRPGGSVRLQGGLDIGYLAFSVHGGFRGIPVDFDRASRHGHPEYEGEGRDSLKNIFFGFGLQGQIPNRSRLLPYLGASFDLNTWHFRETDVGCVGYYYWYCGDYRVWKFTPGFSGRLGTAVDLEGGVYLDLGLGVTMSFEGQFFDDNEVWLEPFLGLGYRG